VDAPDLVEHFFRHEYGRLVATLVRRVGVGHLEQVEDAAQTALLAALDRWPREGRPDVPSAWLFRVARNQLIGDLRTSSRRDRLRRAADLPTAAEPPEASLTGELPDDLLRMLFVCGDPALPADTQLVLALKTLCGFSVSEIAQRRFMSEANVYKRLGRARGRLREVPFEPDALTAEQCAARRPLVLRVLYLMFTEGYLSSHPDLAIRRELCDEALRLGHLLAEHPSGAHPETWALVALTYLHRARLSARQDGMGQLLLLDEQDRGAWDREAIARGCRWLARSAAGEEYSRYHAEARIAAAHALAPSFAATPWADIVQSYELLEQVAPSPMHRLGRALALAELEGPDTGLALLQAQAPPTWLVGSYPWSAALADLHRRCGRTDRAREHLKRALDTAPSEAVRVLLLRRFEGAPDLSDGQGPPGSGSKEGWRR